MGEMNHILEEDTRDFANHFPLWEQLRGKTIAVTGATGLLGSCTIRCLLALNKRHDARVGILAVARNEKKVRSMFAEDIQEISYYIHDFSRDDAFTPPKPVDALLHFASPTASRHFTDHPVDTLLTGIRGTDAILRYAHQARLQSVVFASSLEVYGTIDDDSIPLTEDKQGFLNPMDTRSSYPMAKRAAECLCHGYAMEYGVPVKIGRLAQTFGAGVDKNDKRVFAQFARHVIQGKDIILHTTGELSRCYCYTTDAVSGMLYLLAKGKAGEVYNVANEDTYISIADMARFLCREFRPDIQPRWELRDDQGYSPTTHHRLSTQKMRQLGWTPRYGLREMYHRLILSMKEE